ncbi:MAG: helix-turn-helix domain-containing protein [Marinobacterium sp.]|nr:helix-turn-helix domain-containing protein [Marinobacterium sp.]
MKGSTNNPQLEESFSALSKAVFFNSFEITPALHPRLVTAIKILTEDYLFNLSQSELAERSCISASHLAYLFRTQLGIRFKELLVQLRLLYALSLLKKDPRILITDLCLQAGFGDLSHFEKMFRRYTALSPREARRYFIDKSHASNVYMDRPDMDNTGIEQNDFNNLGRLQARPGGSTTCGIYAQL